MSFYTSVSVESLVWGRHSTSEKIDEPICKVATLNPNVGSSVVCQTHAPTQKESASEYGRMVCGENKQFLRCFDGWKH